MDAQSILCTCALAALGTSCSEPLSVVHDDSPPESAAAMLLVLIDAGSAISSVALSVDGEPWGRFDAVDGQPALVRARLGESRDATRPATLGEWVALLDQPLTPGGHVLSVDTVELVSGATLDGRHFASFEVRPGDESVFVGTVRLESP